MEQDQKQPFFSRDSEEVISLTDQSEVEEKILEEELTR